MNEKLDDRPKIPVLSHLPLHPSLVQFICFGFVGGCGFLMDSAALFLMRPLFGLVAATMGSYVVAASGTWFLNRHWTFSHTRESCTLPTHHQWSRFILANLPGYGLNRSTVFLLYAFLPFTRSLPMIALFAGALAGMGANFTLSKKHVFRKD